jgi:AraC family transcriptional regulator
MPLMVELIRLNSMEPMRAIPSLQHYLLGVILDGVAQGRYRLDEHAEAREVSVSPGTTYFIESQASGSWSWSAESCTLMLVYIPPSLIHYIGAAYGVESGRGTLHTRFVKHDPFRYQLASSLTEVLGDSATCQTEHVLVQSVVCAMILRVITEQGETPLLLRSNDGPLPARARRRLQDYIHAHLEEKITVSDLAAHVDMSPSYFSRMFKDTVGTTPYQYVVHERVREAQILLETTDASLANIALQVGFANQSHLTRQFRKVMHITPGAYRNAVQAARPQGVLSQAAS